MYIGNKVCQLVGQQTSSDTNYTTQISPHNGETHKNILTHSPMYILTKVHDPKKIIQMDTPNHNTTKYAKHRST